MCGIVAYCGSKPADLDKIKILGILNEVRGRHSCGISINGRISWGTNSKSLFRDLLSGTDLKYNRNTKNFNIIAHTRAATHGSHTREYAHPFGFTKKKDVISINNVNPPYNFIGVHNGRLDLWQKLAEKFDLDPKVYNLDSKVLLGGLIQNLEDPEILRMYKGDAAIVLSDQREPNTLYLYKGAGYSGNVEERPLYFWEVRENNKVVGMYISSLEDSLDAIRNGKGKVHSFQGNLLMKVQAGYMVDSTKIERPVKNYYPLASGGRYTGRDWEKESGRNINGRTAVGSKANFDNWDRATNFSMEELELDPEPVNDEVYVHCLRYWSEKTPLDGKFWINKNGEFAEEGDEDEPHLFYFIEGVMCKSKEAYDAFQIEYMKSLKDEVKLYAADVSNFSRYPVCAIGKDDTVLRSSSSKFAYYKGFMFTGDVTPLFTDKIYVFKDDIVNSISTKRDVPPYMGMVRVIKYRNHVVDGFIDMTDGHGVLDEDIKASTIIGPKESDFVPSTTKEEVAEVEEIVIGKEPDVINSELTEPEEYYHLLVDSLDSDIAVLSKIIEAKMEEYLEVIEYSQNKVTDPLRFKYAKLYAMHSLIKQDSSVNFLSGMRTVHKDFKEVIYLKSDG